MVLIVHEGKWFPNEGLLIAHEGVLIAHEGVLGVLNVREGL